MENFIKRFVSLSDAEVAAVALWIAHTCAFTAALWTPYPAITSAAKRCGVGRDVFLFPPSECSCVPRLRKENESKADKLEKDGEDRKPYHEGDAKQRTAGLCSSTGRPGQSAMATSVHPARKLRNRAWCPHAQKSVVAHCQHLKLKFLRPPLDYLPLVLAI